MIRLVVHLILIVLIATLQLSWAIWFDWLMPHLILAVVLALALAGDEIDSLWWAGAGGILLDIMSGAIPGLQLILLSLTSLVLLWLARRTLHRPSLPIAILMFGLTSLGFEALLNLVTGSLYWQMVIPATLTTLLATLCYHVILVVSRRQEVIRLA